MKCKKCKGFMEEIEQGNEEGLWYLIRKCESCGLKCKSWYDLDECMSMNNSWEDGDET